MTDRFNEFWRLYPRKVARRAALKEWDKEVKAGTDPEQIIAGLQRQLPSLIRKEAQFIPHARTWIHQGRWEDEPEPAQTNTLMSAAQAVRERLEFNRDAGRTDQSPSSHYDHAQQLPSTEWH